MSLHTIDNVRRWLNLLLAIGQIVITVASFAFGTSFDDAAGPPSADPPIVPAGYAFTIWSLIYAGYLAYGVYQFAPSRSEDPLLQRIGFFTASGFFGCCCWLVFVRFGHLQLTVPCICWIAVSLFLAFRCLWALDGISLTLRLCVIAPVSIYSRWLTVAIFANTASVAKAFAWHPVLLGESSGSILLIVAAGILATFYFYKSGGNLWYGGTILWALAGIGVRNQFELRNVRVATTAWLLLAVFGFLVWSQSLATGVKTIRR